MIILKKNWAKITNINKARKIKSISKVESLRLDHVRTVNKQYKLLNEWANNPDPKKDYPYLNKQIDAIADSKFKKYRKHIEKNYDFNYVRSMADKGLFIDRKLTRSLETGKYNKKN